MKVLIVDDSVVFRSQIKAAIEGIPKVEVAGVAPNGKIALEKLTPDIDLVTVDMEMPVMGGLDTIKEIRSRKHKARIIVFSSYTTKGSEMTLKALNAGADDFVAKPAGEELNLENAAKKIEEQLKPKILQFLGLPSRVYGDVPLKKEIVPPKGFQKLSAITIQSFRPKVIVIGSSTGGPPVLESLFTQFPKNLRCPILIAQHMPPVFTASLAKRLGDVSGVPSSEGTAGAPLENRIYVAPGDYHMTIKGTETSARISTDQSPAVNHVRPAVDPLFESAVKVFGKNVMGIVLTGMGADGAKGSAAIKEVGGLVLIQDAESCVVFGMPGAVKELNAFDLMLNPSEIRSHIVERVAA